MVTPFQAESGASKLFFSAVMSTLGTTVNNIHLFPHCLALSCTALLECTCQLGSFYSVPYVNSCKWLETPFCTTLSMLIMAILVNVQTYQVTTALVGIVQTRPNKIVVVEVVVVVVVVVVVIVVVVIYETLSINTEKWLYQLGTQKFEVFNHTAYLLEYHIYKDK